MSADRARSPRRGLVAGLGLLALAGTLLGVPAASAAAAGYVVVLTTSTPVVTYGDDAAFAATVTAGDVPAAALGVGLWRTGPDGVETFVDYATTDAAGTATFTAARPAGRSTYVARVDVDQATSAPVTVEVAYAVLPPEQTSFYPRRLLTPVAVPPGGQVTLQGRIAPAGSTAPLTVEQRFGAGPWQPVGTAAVAPDGTFTLPLGRRSAVGTWTVRVSHPAEGALAAGAGEASVRVTVTGVGPARAWRPVVGTRSHPARWGTCRIGYRVNERRMPPAGLADLREAMRRVTQVSGIRFRYLGATSVTPTLRYHGPGRNRMVVAWAPPASSGGLLTNGIAGVGATARTRTRLLTAYLLINSRFSAAADPGFGAGQPHGLVLMHELGHVVGLDHSPDARQVMAAGSPRPAAVWGAADIRGLRRLGSRCR